MQFSNMSNAEYFKYNGTLSAERVEYLLDLEDKAGNDVFKELSDECREAKPSIEEDFLSDVVEDLQRLLKCVRGENRQLVADIIEQLEQKQTELRQAMEYTNEKLDEIFNALQRMA